MTTNDTAPEGPPPHAEGDTFLPKRSRLRKLRDHARNLGRSVLDALKGAFSSVKHFVKHPSLDTVIAVTIGSTIGRSVMAFYLALVCLASALPFAALFFFAYGAFELWCAVHLVDPFKELVGLHNHDYAHTTTPAAPAGAFAG